MDYILICTFKLQQRTWQKKGIRLSFKAFHNEGFVLVCNGFLTCEMSVIADVPEQREGHVNLIKQHQQLS